jgi:serine/threonine protein kinase
MLKPDTILQGRYKILETIGQGGMGAVYKALDERLGNIVALKQTFFNDDEMARAFEREARLLASLDHPALPKVSDHFVENDGQFLIMEFIPGDDLGQMLKQRGHPFDYQLVLEWSYQLLDVLEYLHQKRPPIIHRDIKPQNLKLNARERIVLLDFGLAKGAPQLADLDASSIFGYTLNYAPLEQIQHAGSEERSDLFSLAATLYHLMTATAPLGSLTRAGAIVNGEPDPVQPPHFVNPLVPAAVGQLIIRAMSLRRGDRPIGARAMREEFDEAIGIESEPKLRACSYSGNNQPEPNRASTPPVAPVIIDPSEALTRLIKRAGVPDIRIPKLLSGYADGSRLGDLLQTALGRLVHTPWVFAVALLLGFFMLGLIARDFSRTPVPRRPVGSTSETRRRALQAPALIPANGVPIAEDGNVTLRWSAVQGANEYTVQTFNKFGSVSNEERTKETEYRVRLTDQTSSVRVTAVGADQTLSPSSEWPIAHELPDLIAPSDPTKDSEGRTQVRWWPALGAERYEVEIATLDTMRIVDQTTGTGLRVRIPDEAVYIRIIAIVSGRGRKRGTWVPLGDLYAGYPGR